MNIEQLQLVIQALQSVSGDVLKGAILYIAFLFAKEVLAYAMGGAVLFTIYKAVIYITNSIRSASEAMEVVKRIRRSLRLDPMGQTYGTMHGSQLESTAVAVELMVEKIKDEANAKKAATDAKGA